jgi:hypothetical protein
VLIGFAVAEKSQQQNLHLKKKDSRTTQQT